MIFLVLLLTASCCGVRPVHTQHGALSLSETKIEEYSAKKNENSAKHRKFREKTELKKNFFLINLLFSFSFSILFFFYIYISIGV